MSRTSLQSRSKNPVLALVVSMIAIQASADDLVQPRRISVEASLPARQAQQQILVAKQYYSFWNTGDARYAETALAPDFIDTSLPSGRPQGPRGPILASQGFRKAVPDLKLEVEEMIVTADKVIGRLHFTGHFSGSFGERKGDGRAIDFMAVDIYTIKNGRIAENWHLEDNLSLMQQLGVVAQ